MDLFVHGYAVGGGGARMETEHSDLRAQSHQCCFPRCPSNTYGLQTFTFAYQTSIMHLFIPQTSMAAYCIPDTVLSEGDTEVKETWFLTLKSLQSGENPHK